MQRENPYQSPTSTAVASPRPQRSVRSRRHLALGFLVFSIVLALGYTFIDEVVIGPIYRAWPMLLGTAVISVVAAFVTNDVIVSPLCCFAATMAGDVEAALIQNWSYAQPLICLPLAAGFSLPAVIVAVLMRRFRAKPGEPSD